MLTSATREIDRMDAPSQGMARIWTRSARGSLISGLTSYEAQRILRGLRGVDFVAADLVEVSPALDQGGTTALVAANLAFEMVCLLADRVAARPHA